MKHFLSVLMMVSLCADVAVAARSKEDFNFEKQGVQVGEPLPALAAHVQSGPAVWLSDYYGSGLTLIVCESLTCPVARRTHTGLKEIAKRYGDRLDILVFYTIEAHPKSDPSPYSEGEEWVTRANEKLGILCRQPKRLQERIQLAERLKKSIAIESTLLVDCMDNAGWRALGSGPNVAVLVDPQGMVLAKQGWFNPKKMATTIKRTLKKRTEPKSGQHESSANEAAAKPRCDCLTDPAAAIGREETCPD